MIMVNIRAFWNEIPKFFKRLSASFINFHMRKNFLVWVTNEEIDASVKSNVWALALGMAMGSDKRNNVST